jgi:Trypsin-co-occurring domain 2
MAMDQATGEEIRFRVGPVELEFLLEVTREVGAEGGVKFYVVSLGAKGGVARTSTHRIKLSLVPVTAEGKDLRVAEEVPERPR